MHISTNSTTAESAITMLNRTWNATDSRRGAHLISFMSMKRSSSLCKILAVAELLSLSVLAVKKWFV